MTSAHGDVTFDVNTGTVSDARGNSVVVDAQQDPLTPGLVGVDPSGTQALVMASRGMHSDPQLVLVDLHRKTSTVMHAFDGPGWIAGGFCHGDVVVCAQRLGEKPVFNVVVGTRPVLSVEGLQQPCVPVACQNGLVALVMAPKIDPITGTGDSALVVIDPRSGASAPLVAAAGERVRVDGDGSVLVVEGGRETVRVTLA